MRLSEELIWRGLVKDKTFSDDSFLDSPGKFYLGIDASSDSLTIGNLAVLMLARRLLDAGWQAVLLAGGATSLVGDPGGKQEERQLKNKEEISRNIDGVKVQIERLFSGLPHELVNNLDWLGDIRYLDFLRDVGKHFSMTELMQREFVDARMGESGAGISYAEFSYSLLQGYDYWWLFKNKEVVLQIGASDQWGNILSGVSLVRKKEGKEVHALCMPLVINKATGQKFGKSEGGAVWLDAAKTTAFKFYQFWINSDDDDVEEYLKIFTLLTKDEIEQAMSAQQANPGDRPAQKVLADAVTELVHGAEVTEKARNATSVVLGKRPVGEVSEDVIQLLREELPAVKAKSGEELAEVLVRAGLVSSKREAREIGAAGGVYINNESSNKEFLEDNDFQNGRLLIRRGKAYKDTAMVELA